MELEQYAAAIPQSSRCPKSGHFTCYLNRTYHVLTKGDSFPCTQLLWYKSLTKPLPALHASEMARRKAP
jgi:hypothetical protein